MDVNTVLILAYVDDYFKANKIAAELSKKNFTVRMEFPDSFDFDSKIRASLLRCDAVIYVISSQVLASDKYYELHGIVQENQRTPKPEVYVALNKSIDDLFLDIYKHDEYSDDILLRADDYRMELEQKNVICQSPHLIDDIEKLLKSLKEEVQEEPAVEEPAVEEKAIESEKEEEAPAEEEPTEEPALEAVEETVEEEAFKEALEEPVEETAEEAPAEEETLEEPAEEEVEEVEEAESSDESEEAPAEEVSADDGEAELAEKFETAINELRAKIAEKDAKIAELEAKLSAKAEAKNAFMNKLESMLEFTTAAEPANDEGDAKTTPEKSEGDEIVDEYSAAFANLK